MPFGMNHINADSSVQYLRRGLHLQIFDPSRRLVNPRISIYVGHFHNDVHDNDDLDIDCDDHDI